MRRDDLPVRRTGPGWRALAALGPLSVVVFGLAAATGPARMSRSVPLAQEAEAMPPMKNRDGGAFTAAALAGFRERTEESGAAVDWFNLGAALLLSGDWEGSVEPLQRALDADEPGIEQSAAYDLALAHALAGRPPELGGGLPFEERRPLLEQAWDGFRWVLRQDPDAEDARWNLELVGRWLEREEDPSDEGGGGGGGAPEADQADRPSTPELSAEEALDLLEQAAEEERNVQGRRLERNRARDPVVERNW